MNCLIIDLLCSVQVVRARRQLIGPGECSRDTGPTLELLRQNRSILNKTRPCMTSLRLSIAGREYICFKIIFILFNLIGGATRVLFLDNYRHGGVRVK